MADRGRDLTLSIISKANQFDLDKPASELEHLGDSAGDAATKVDKAFDRIQDASRTSMRQVDANLDKGKAGLDDFKNEAHSSGREAAASFTGTFDDITSTVQEVAANAFAGFGPIGAAAGLAAAAGIGFIISSINESKERVKELTQTFLDLRKDGIDPASDAASHLVDELDTTQMSGFKKDADDLGISYKTLRDAFDGNADAIRNVRAAIDEHVSGLDQALGINNYDNLVTKLDETETAYNNAGDAAAFLEQQTETAKQRTEDMSGALQGVSTDAADMAEAINTSADAVIDAQTRQLTAMHDFEVNTKTVFERVGQAGVDWALAQGDNADEAMQLLADAPLSKAKQIAANYEAAGVKSSESYAGGVLAGRGAATTAAGQVHEDMRAIMRERIDVPIGVTPPSRSELNGLAGLIKATLAGITIPVQPVVGNVYIPNKYASRYAPGG